MNRDGQGVLSSAGWLGGVPPASPSRPGEGETLGEGIGARPIHALAAFSFTQPGPGGGCSGSGEGRRRAAGVSGAGKNGVAIE